jgi:ABC-type transporter Mla subunit MlaD
MSSIIGFVVELAVLVLLAFTVAYCIILDRRLQKLRADETQMRQTVVDLGLATSRAENAIDGMRRALVDCEATISERLKSAEEASAGLKDDVRTADEVLDRIGRIVSTAKKAVTEAEARLHVVVSPAPEIAQAQAAPMLTGKLSDTLAAAEAFAARARKRMLEGQPNGSASEAA